MRYLIVTALGYFACNSTPRTFTPVPASTQSAPLAGGLCKSDSDCITGESCNTTDNRCQPTCLKDADCAASSVCGPDDFCIPRSSLQSTTGGGDTRSPCTLQNAGTACQDDQLCNTIDGGGSCTPASKCPNGQTDCPQGQVCTTTPSGVFCKNPAPCAGGTCDAGLTCTNGFCVPTDQGTTGGSSGGSTGTSASSGGEATGGTSGGGVAPTYGPCTFDTDCDWQCGDGPTTNAPRMNGSSYGDLGYTSDYVCDITATEQQNDIDNNTFSGVCRDRCALIDGTDGPVIAVACPVAGETCVSQDNTDNAKYLDLYCGISDDTGDYSACR